VPRGSFEVDSLAGRGIDGMGSYRNVKTQGSSCEKLNGSSYSSGQTNYSNTASERSESASESHPPPRTLKRMMVFPSRRKSSNRNTNDIGGEKRALIFPSFRLKALKKWQEWWLVSAGFYALVFVIYADAILRRDVFASMNESEEMKFINTSLNV
jgi:hypothetical protein